MNVLFGNERESVVVGCQETEEEVVLGDVKLARLMYSRSSRSCRRKCSSPSVGMPSWAELDCVYRASTDIGGCRPMWAAW
jgi:hypothetical protein